jgi:hypothetical protein
MNFDIRKLESTNDLLQAEEIFVSHDKVMRGKVSVEKDVFFRSLINAGHTLVGAFKDEELYAFMTYKLFTQLPICQVGNIYTKKGKFTSYKFSNRSNPIPKILDFILTDIESKKYYTWYYCRANLDIYKKLEDDGEGLLRWSEKSFDNSTNSYRYERYIEEIIPVKKSSQFLLHTKMFALGLWEKETIIFKCCLKNEYRDKN